MTVEDILIDTSRMQRLRGQLGSNPGGVFQDEGGQRYYVKTLESPLYARNEMIAAKLYQLAGAPTLTYVNCITPDQVATVWAELDKKHISQFSDSERKQAQQWFAVHCWTANWDVAGFDGDNQGVVNGQVITLDVGGALTYRAQGDPKGKAFGTEVNELNTLRTDLDNPHAVKLFSDMREDDIKQSIIRVTQIPDQQIRQLVSDSGGSGKLADKMIARKANMARYLAVV